MLCAKKDVFLPKHHDIEVPNLHVIKLMESFVSKGLVTVVFNWQWFYWTLTDKGIEYLRSYMSLPEDIVPNSMKQSAKKLAPRRQFDDEQGAGRGGFRGGRGGFRGGRGGRDEYRGPRGDGEGGVRVVHCEVIVVSCIASGIVFFIMAVIVRRICVLMALPLLIYFLSFFPSLLFVSPSGVVAIVRFLSTQSGAQFRGGRGGFRGGRGGRGGTAQ